MNKTLIGQNDYLFLINDSNNEINNHINNICIPTENSIKKYTNIIDKYVLVIFPDKSIQCQQFLPYNNHIMHRASVNFYKRFLEDNTLDCYMFLKNYDDIFYKTDTHMNLKGCVIVYHQFINFINKKFNLNIEPLEIKVNSKTVDNLNSLNIGIGDLTWPQNIGDNLKLNLNLNDTYYYSLDFIPIYCNDVIKNYDINILDFKNNTLNNLTEHYLDVKLDWEIVSKYIIYKYNSHKIHNVVIFYDSFLLSTLPLYLNMFNKVYLIKNLYNQNIIDIINPDYIFEFRVERFLC